MCYGLTTAHLHSRNSQIPLTGWRLLFVSQNILMFKEEKEYKSIGPWRKKKAPKSQKLLTQLSTLYHFWELQIERTRGSNCKLQGKFQLNIRKKIQSQCLRSEALPRETVQTPSLEIFKTYQVNVQPYTLFGYLFSAFNHPLLHFVQLPDNSTE